MNIMPHEEEIRFLRSRLEFFQSECKALQIALKIKTEEHDCCAEDLVLLRRINDERDSMKTMNRAAMKWEDHEGLKPCPNCGREATFRRVNPTLNGGKHPLAGAEYIECTNRGCGTSSVAMFSMMDDCKPMLAERWNRRVVP